LEELYAGFALAGAVSATGTSMRRAAECAAIAGRELASIMESRRQGRENEKQESMNFMKGNTNDR